MFIALGGHVNDPPATTTQDLDLQQYGTSETHATIGGRL
jgi:hypothetical protein